MAPSFTLAWTGHHFTVVTSGPQHFYLGRLGFWCFIKVEDAKPDVRCALLILATEAGGLLQFGSSRPARGHTVRSRWAPRIKAKVSWNTTWQDVSIKDWSNPSCREISSTLIPSGCAISSPPLPHRWLLPHFDQQNSTKYSWGSLHN